VRSMLGISGGVLAIVAIAVLALGPAVATAHSDGKQTLRLVATEDQFEFVDLGAPGPSLGDELVFSEVLRQRGREVGTSGVVCTVTAIEVPYESQMFHCVGTLSLRKGQITLQGLLEVQGEDDPGPFDVAITGGTGAYRGAGGEATVFDISEDRSVYILRFDSGKNRKHRR
jgi:Allene oxide cyclase barrel like domain